MTQSVEDLLEALEDVDDATREDAAKALAELADPSTLEPLLRAFEDEFWSVRAHAAWGVGRIGGLRAAEAADPTHPPRGMGGGEDRRPPPRAGRRSYPPTRPRGRDPPRARPRPTGAAAALYSA